MVGTWTGPVIFGGGPDRAAYTSETWTYEGRVHTWREVRPCLRSMVAVR